VSKTLEVGAEVPPLQVTADPCSMMLVTLITGDPNPIHFDTGATARLGLGDRPVNQGAITMAWPVNAVMAWLRPHWRVERVRVRFQGNVFAGDTVDVGGTVADVTTGPSRARAKIDVWVRLASGKVVLDGEVVVVAVDSAEA
jgi:acyl dehydratase